MIQHFDELLYFKDSTHISEYKSKRNDPAFGLGTRINIFISFNTRVFQGLLRGSVFS